MKRDGLAFPVHPDHPSLDWQQTRKKEDFYHIKNINWLSPNHFLLRANVFVHVIWIVYKKINLNAPVSAH